MDVPLNHGKVAVIDDEDWPRVVKYRWRYKKSTGYAVASFWDKSSKRVVDVLMHRLINDTPNGMHTDHINRDRLDNRKVNLETVTPKINTLRGISPPAVNAKKTHCPRGHEYTPENTRPNSGGSHTRNCRECGRATFRAWYRKNRATT